MFPDEPVIGASLIGAGVLVFVISTVWGLVSYFRGHKRRTAAVPTSAIGDITINTGDSNKIGDIGHRVDSREEESDARRR